MTGLDGLVPPDAGAGISFRRVCQADAEALHGLSVCVRWSHRLEDWRLLLSIGSGFVALYEGRVVGVTLYWHQGAAHATIGCVIVLPALQGRHIGYALMTQTLAACNGRTVSLNATPQGVGLYARLGFVDTAITAQHQALVLDSAALSIKTGRVLRAMTTCDYDTLIELSSCASGMDRRVVLDAYFTVAQGVVVECEGKVNGFALIRPSGRGMAVGPVVAYDLATAQALISELLLTCRGRFVRIDVPENAVLCDWLVSLGLPKVDRLRVMVTCTQEVASDAPRIFARLNQALF